MTIGHLTKDKINRLINQSKESDSKITELKRKLVSAETNHENTKQVMETYRNKCSLMRNMITNDKKSTINEVFKVNTYKKQNIVALPYETKDTNQNCNKLGIENNERLSETKKSVENLLDKKRKEKNLQQPTYDKTKQLNNKRNSLNEKMMN